METHAWILLVAMATATLAGCLDDDQTGGNETTEPSTDDEVLPPEPQTQELSCSSQPGTGVVITNNIGGCVLGSAEFDATAVTVEAASGCTIQYDENEDTQYDGVVEQGAAVSQGWTLAAFCDPGAAGDHLVTLEEQL